MSPATGRICTQNDERSGLSVGVRMLSCMVPCIERAIAEQALRQLGHISYRQLRTLGVTPKVVRRLVSTGWLVPVGRATFRLGGVSRTYEGDVMAACLDVGAVASHRTAAVLHG